MKKTVFVLSLFLLLSLVGCGDKGPEIGESEAIPIEESAEELDKVVEDTVSLSGDNTDELLPLTYKVPFNDIYVDVPPYVVLEQGYSDIYWMETKYVAFTCQYEDTVSSLDEAYDQTCHKFMVNVHSEHKVNEIDKVTKEEVTVNGIDAIRLRGTANCGGNPIYDAYIYGYAFVMNEHPCSIIGVVVDETQPQEEIDGVTEYVDAMMATVRTAP